jgi:DNA sulfur modification protein DndD
VILERIVLHNYGPYRGRHEIDLSPRPPKRPVILFGGMNGGGKTSLLNALQLVLFGRQSNVWQARTGYEAHLKGCINRHVSPDEGAGIELTFSNSSQGTEQTIHVSRYWRVVGAKVKESLDVIRDGELDTVLAENWSDWVEDYIPARVAPLFFFDGEKIEQLANPEESAQILRSAVHSLLGLDIVDQLQNDLEILERRKRKQVEQDNPSTPLVQREQELDRTLQMVDRKLSDLHQQAASKQNDIDRCNKRLQELDRALANQGGSAFENRHLLEAERDAAAEAGVRIEDQLRELAAEALPLACVMPALQRLENSARRSQGMALHAELMEVLAARDQSILDQAQTLQASKKLLSDLAAFLEQDRAARAQASSDEPALLDTDGRTRVHALIEHILPSTLAKAKELLGEIEKHDFTAQTAERKLAAIPSEERIKPMLDERDRLRIELEGATRAQEITREMMRVETLEQERLRRSLENIRTELADSMLGDEDTARTLRHSAKARDTLRRFRERVLQGHVERIEKLAMESFGSLMRKQRMVSDLRIDPQTFVVELRDSDGQVVPPEKMSAGERQLLAVALLWGLSRAAGRPIPTVIDTPLGRLDTAHRSTVIERYFPFASHQVLLLSTDAEIDERAFAKLSPHVARSYRLEFDDSKQVSGVNEGYFWEAST